jgi:cell division protein FtsL
MATKSFNSDLHFSDREIIELITAIENSKRAENDINKTVNDVSQPDTITNIIEEV